MRLQHFEHKLRPFFQDLLSEKAFSALYSLARPKAIKALENFTPSKGIINQTHSIKLFDNLNFRNDLGNAAGFDKDGSLLPFNYKIGAGFSVVGTVLNKKHSGNLYKNYGMTSNMWTPLTHSDSALNSLGLPSLGIDHTLDNIKKFCDRFQPKNFPIGLSIMGHPAEEGQKKHDGVLQCIEKAKDEVDFFEINESCPNVSHHDSDLGELQIRLQSIHEARKSVQKTTPVFIKMGKIPDARGLLELLLKENIEGLVALNTQTDYPTFKKLLHQKDHKLFDYYTGNYKGGMSGKIIREHSLSTIKNLNEINSTLPKKIELIHVGGISNPEDVKQSRNYCELREWYTCFMSALGSQEWENIYSNMTAT